MPTEPDTTPAKPAVVLLSGGLDSTTTLALAREQGFRAHAISFDYGQRHRVELEAAAKAAQRGGAHQHVVAKLDLGVFGGSALTSSGIVVPKDRPADEIETGIPVTYVPARNAVFLSFALAWAEVLGSFDIFIGVNAVDYSGYPDCRPEFIESFEAMANRATKVAVEGKGRFRVHTPLIDLTKAQIIAEGLRLGVDYSQTITCYDPSEDGVACGRCDACYLRLKGFAQNGVEDPAPYQVRPST